MIDEEIRVVVSFDDPIEFVSVLCEGELKGESDFLRQMIITRQNGLMNRRDGQLFCDVRFDECHLIEGQLGHEEEPIAPRTPSGVDSQSSCDEILRNGQNEAKNSDRLTKFDEDKNEEETRHQLGHDDEENDHERSRCGTDRHEARTTTSVDRCALSTMD